MSGYLPNLPLSDGTWLAVATVCPPAVATPNELRAIDTPADLIEIRIDLIDGVHEPGAWIEASPRPVLATLRSKQEGGAYEGTVEEAATQLRAWLHAGAAWIDAEADVGRVLSQQGVDETCCLPSMHDVSMRRVNEGDVTPSDRWSKCAMPVDTRDSWDAIVARQASQSGFTVPLGALAHTRTAFVGDHCAGLLFGAHDEQSRAVPGQPVLSKLVNELRAGEVDSNAALFGLVGEPPAWSPSPAMHNSVFRYADANALYVPFQKMTLRDAITLPVQGLSVTKPYKRDAFDLADDLGRDAKRAEAVNTLVRIDGDYWRGLNTDVAGIREMVDAYRPVDGAARVYGSGGYARAAILALKSLGFETRLAARNEDDGKALAAATGCAWSGGELAPADDESILLNATPAGHGGTGALTIDPERLRNRLVLDAPYAAPNQTTDLVQAAERGQADTVIDGRTLLLAQARHQALAFLSIVAPSIDQNVAPWIPVLLSFGMTPPRNLVLLGPRGVGKSTVGAAVARLTGRPFVDLDDSVSRISGRSPAAWIESNGESAFRAIEAAALSSAVRRRGVVIACGSGVVEHLPNKHEIESAFVVLLDAAPHVTAERIDNDRRSRPRLYDTKDALDEASVLRERRLAAWNEWSDVSIDASLDVGPVVDAVLEAWLPSLSGAIS